MQSVKINPRLKVHWNELWHVHIHFDLVGESRLFKTMRAKRGCGSVSDIWNRYPLLYFLTKSWNHVAFTSICLGYLNDLHILYSLLHEWYGSIQAMCVSSQIKETKLLFSCTGHCATVPFLSTLGGLWQDSDLYFSACAAFTCACAVL